MGRVTACVPKSLGCKLVGTQALAGKNGSSNENISLKRHEVRPMSGLFSLKSAIFKSTRDVFESMRAILSLMRAHFKTKRSIFVLKCMHFVLMFGFLMPK